VVGLGMGSADRSVRGRIKPGRGNGHENPARYNELNQRGCQSSQDDDPRRSPGHLRQSHIWFRSFPVTPSPDSPDSLPWRVIKHKCYRPCGRVADKRTGCHLRILNMPGASHAPWIDAISRDSEFSCSLAMPVPIASTGVLVVFVLSVEVSAQLEYRAAGRSLLGSPLEETDSNFPFRAR
jgi:hypothetical protein